MRSSIIREPAPFIILGLATIGAALTIATGSAWWLALVVAPGILWMIFRDTMNVFQWFPWWGKSERRIYWVTRNTANSAQKRIDFKASVYFDFQDDGVERYFHGHGVQFRFRHWSFQVGFGRRLQASPWHRRIDVPVEEIRKGVTGVWIEEDSVTHS